MPDWDEYQNKAELFIAQAELACNSEGRTALLRVAQSYRRLADLIGKRGDRATAHLDQRPSRDFGA